MKTTKRHVKAYLNGDGIVVFKLLDRATIVRTFGYATHHKLWLELEGLDTDVVCMSECRAGTVKEAVSQWSAKE